MLALRYARFWAAMAWLGIGLAIFLTVLPTGASPVPVGGRLQHITGYFIMTSWFTGIYPRARYPLIGLGCLLFGGGMEMLQIFSPTRHPAVKDALTNGIGIGLALGAAYAGLGGWATRIERLLGAG